jgi:hypothetical protein
MAGRDERMVAAQSNQRMILPQGAHQVGTPVPLEKPDIHFGRRGGRIGQELDRWLEAERRLSKDHKTLGKLKRNKRDVDGKKKKKKG